MVRRARMDGFWSRVLLRRVLAGRARGVNAGRFIGGVMPGLVPGIHDRDKGVTVDGRDKPGHDGVGVGTVGMTLRLNFNNAG